MLRFWLNFAFYGPLSLLILMIAFGLADLRVVFFWIGYLLMLGFGVVKLESLIYKIKKGEDINEVGS